MKLQIKKIKSPTSNKSSQKNKKYQDFLEKKVTQKEVKKSLLMKFQMLVMSQLKI